jgi:hypothetical protein
MTKKHAKGDSVSWKWGSGTAEATVQETFERRVQRTIKGSKIVKNGSEENPAYLVEQEDGATALKLHSELS